MHVKRKKKKRYINVFAPKIFDEVEIGIIITDPDHNVVGRTLEVSLYKLTKNPLHQFIKCKLRISRVLEEDAWTIYYGHEYFREYIKSLFMKGSSYIDVYKNIIMQDGTIYRALASIFTSHRINTSKKKVIRKNVSKLFDDINYDSNNEFIRDMLFGIIDSMIMRTSRKIYPIRWAGVQKVKVVRLGKSLESVK